MNVIVKLPVEIPEETIAEFAKQTAGRLVNDDRDLVPVVRCKDCIYLGVRGMGYGYCKNNMCGVVRPNDYCSRGIKKERETKI